jgi:hypothetical protein
MGLQTAGALVQRTAEERRRTVQKSGKKNQFKASKEGVATSYEYEYWKIYTIV